MFLDVRGVGDNTLTLVEQAVKFKEQGEYDQTWCVFDRDSFPADRFNRALELAHQKGMQIAYSNEAFELWYLLHFAYHDAATSRADYGDRLSRHLGSRYAKNRDDVFDLLEARQPDAIRNAERLMAQYPAPGPGGGQPLNHRSPARRRIEQIPPPVASHPMGFGSASNAVPAAHDGIADFGDAGHLADVVDADHGSPVGDAEGNGGGGALFTVVGVVSAEDFAEEFLA